MPLALPFQTTTAFGGPADGGPADDSGDVARQAAARGDAALAAGDSADAVACYRQALAACPDAAAALYNLGRVLRDWDGAGAAAGAWRRRAFVCDPGALPQANHALGLAFEAAGRPGEALGCHLQALAQQPDHAEAGDAVLRLARPWLEGGGTGEPPFLVAWAEVGHVAFRRAEYVAALAAFRRQALACPGDAAVWRYVGDACFLLSRFDEAVAAFRRSLMLTADAGDVWRCLGGACFQLLRFDEAAAAFRRSLALAPGGADVWRNLGHTLYQLRRFAGADGALVRANRADPSVGAPLGDRVRARYRLLNARTAVLPVGPS